MLISTLPVGTHVITAHYDGDELGAPSTSGPVILEIVAVEPVPTLSPARVVVLALILGLGGALALASRKAI